MKRKKPNPYLVKTGVTNILTIFQKIFLLNIQDIVVSRVSEFIEKNSIIRIGYTRFSVP